MDPLVDELLAAARAAVDQGRPPPTTFLIPTPAGLWRVSCAGAAAAGANDLGIPPRAFAYGAVGLLVASLGSDRCVAFDPSMAPPGERSGALPGAAIVVTEFRRGSLGVTIQERVPAGWGEPATRMTDQPGPLGPAIPLWRAVNREPGPLPPIDVLLDDMTDSGFTVEQPGQPNSGPNSGKE